MGNLTVDMHILRILLLRRVRMGNLKRAFGNGQGEKEISGDKVQCNLA